MPRSAFLAVEDVALRVYLSVTQVLRLNRRSLTVWQPSEYKSRGNLDELDAPAPPEAVQIAYLDV